MHALDESKSVHFAHARSHFLAWRRPLECSLGKIRIVIIITCLFKYAEIFTIKNENFQMKNSDILDISAQSIDCALRKLAYSNILKILQSKTENFQIKNSDIFHTSAQNIDCGYS